MNKKEKIVWCLVTSDWHISVKQPIIRNDDNWIGVQGRYIRQVARIAEQFNCPVVIAGDIFHTWNEPAESINLILANIPKNVYAIPGQHDLPYHSLDQIKRSSYWTLVEAGAIIHIAPGKPLELPNIRFFGFPFGIEVTPKKVNKGLYLDIAVIHSYIWKTGKGYDNSPKEKLLGNWLPKIRGYDCTVFGDNHIPFVFTSEHESSVINCGTLIRRRKNELKYKPRIGVIFSDGSITRIPLDTSGDVFLTTVPVISKERTSSGQVDSFVDELGALGEQHLDYEGLVKRKLEEDGVSESVKKKALMALESK